MPRQIIDFHTHIGNDKDKTKFSKAELLHSMKEAHISHSVVFVLNERKTSVLQASLSLLKKCKNNPLYPFLRFDPKKMTTTKLKKLLPNFYGVKLHPRSQNFDPLNPTYFSLYKVITSSSKPVLFHTREEHNPYSDPDRVVSLCHHFPKLKIVIGHFGNYSSVVIHTMKKHKNVFIETSLMGSGTISLKHVIKVVGSKQILFGSDVPYGDQIVEKLKIERARINRDDLHNILYNNAKTLLKI